ncbi:MAG TPA: hypothetical protein IAC84_06535 [Firmicutes bacterium]|nr:hypothetical protein [Bacillota bacterium]
MRDIWITLLALTVVYCIVYAIKPTVSRSFQQKYGKSGAPKSAIRTARVAGAAIAVVGTAVLLYLLIQERPGI